MIILQQLVIIIKKNILLFSKIKIKEIFILVQYQIIQIKSFRKVKIISHRII
jgi:hypothetical protein